MTAAAGFPTDVPHPSDFPETRSFRLVLHEFEDFVPEPAILSRRKSPCETLFDAKDMEPGCAFWGSFFLFERRRNTLRIQRRVPCWAIIHPAEDLPGVWVGHCLDLDVVSQANSPEQALRMVQDASAMTLQDDLERGAEPTARRAPEELWQLLSRIQHEGQQVHGIREAARAIKEEGDPLVMIAAQFTLHIEEQTMLEPAQDAPLFLLSNVEQRAC